MSRENLKDFFYAVEHSAKLRETIKKQCDTPSKIIELAQEYGFNITIEDFAQDDEAQRIDSWFKKSKLLPIKKK